MSRGLGCSRMLRTFLRGDIQTETGRIESVSYDIQKEEETPGPEMGTNLPCLRNFEKARVGKLVLREDNRVMVGTKGCRNFEAMAGHIVDAQCLLND